MSWSHIAVDFMMDLPVSKGYTVVLIVVDQFSKGVWFLTFVSLPTALEVDEVLFCVMFLHYGILEDILSDQGPHFVSYVCLL